MGRINADDGGHTDSADSADFYGTQIKLMGRIDADDDLALEGRHSIAWWRKPQDMQMDTRRSPGGATLHSLVA